MIATSLASWATKHYLSRRLQRLESVEKDPETTQRRVWRSLMRAAASTEWGARFGNSGLDSVEAFSKNVPLGDYESHRDAIKRMMEGGVDLLCPGRVTRFAKSSGTTVDRSKYIPVPSRNTRRCHVGGAADALALWFRDYPRSNLFRGVGLTMGGSLDRHKKGRCCIGDVSALMVASTPFFARGFQALDSRTALWPDWEEKIEEMVRRTPRLRITSLSGVPTWMMVYLQKLTHSLGTHEAIEALPNLELVLHGGVSFSPYADQFRRCLPSERVRYREVYNASEGFFAVADQDGTSSMRLLLDNDVFFEFVPMESIDAASARTHWIRDVEIGCPYAMAITTSSGLFRYLIGDTVEFTSLNPHRIRITGRTAQQLNVFGEEVVVGQTDHALASACQATGSEVSEYTVGPIFMTEASAGGHEWLIEFRRAPASPSEFERVLDEELRSRNSDYDAKRAGDCALRPLIVQRVERGTFHRWMKSRGRYGGQNKVPRLHRDRRYLDAIRAFDRRER